MAGSLGKRIAKIVRMAFRNTSREKRTLMVHYTVKKFAKNVSEKVPLGYFKSLYKLS